MVPSTNLAPREVNREFAVEPSGEADDRLRPHVRILMLSGVAVLLSVWGVFLAERAARLIAWLAHLSF